MAEVQNREAPSSAGSVSRFARGRLSVSLADSDNTLALELQYAREEIARLAFLYAEMTRNNADEIKRLRDALAAIRYCADPHIVTGWDALASDWNKVHRLATEALGG